MFYPNNFNSITSKFLYPIFNTNDFNDGSQPANKNDLSSYANLYKQNYFTETNYFTEIFANSVNGLSQVTYQYLIGISENVQDAITFLKNNTYGILFDDSTYSTIINNDLISNNFGTSNLSTNNASISNMLIAYLLNVNKITSQNINSQNLYSNNITCNNLNYNNDIGIYLFTLVTIPNYGNSTISSFILYPLIKSQNANNFLSSTNYVYLLFHIKPNYRIDILNSNNFVIYSFKNTTSNIIYNKTITLINIYFINIYLNDNIII